MEIHNDFLDYICPGCVLEDYVHLDLIVVGHNEDYVRNGMGYVYLFLLTVCNLLLLNHSWDHVESISVGCNL